MVVMIAVLIDKREKLCSLKSELNQNNFFIEMMRAKLIDHDDCSAKKPGK